MSKRLAFPIIGILLIVLVIAAILVGGVSAGTGTLLTFFPLKHLQQTGSINLIMSVTPQATTPGETVNLEILVTSGRSQPATPEIQISIPNKLSFQIEDIPAGASFNLQANAINWQPLLQPGESSRILIPLTVNVADLHQPEQTITALLSDGENQQTFSQNVWIGTMPQVAVVFDPPQVAVGQPVQIRANISGPGPFTQVWSLGDGRVLAVNDPVVVFPASGSFQVSVQVSNPLGTITAGSLIRVVPVPAAKFSVDDATPAVNQTIQFTNESGGEGQLVYNWNFGDGVTSQEENPSHAYTTPGNYEVILTVRNEHGQSQISQLVIAGQPPIADIVIPQTAVAGTLINFQAFVDDSVTSISWDMGDGHTYEGPNVSHVYWRADTYNVTMTAGNEYDSYQVSAAIQIEAGALAFYLPFIRKGGESDASPEVVDFALDTTRPGAEMPAERQTLVPYEFPPNLSQEEMLLAYLNQAREMNGLPPVTYNATIAQAAQAHTIDMATNGFGGIPGTSEYTPHTGSDGSTPALRLQRTGYPGGYGAEATAWGFQTAIEPVEYWLNNPPHRRIILNPYVDEVGVDYEINLDAPNIWYWTAVFASMSIPKVEVPEVVATPAPNPTPEPVLQLLGPPQNSEFVLAPGNNLIFTWSWNGPVEEGQRFVVYLRDEGRTFQIGSVQESAGNNQYQFKTAVTNVPVSAGSFEWQVRLENFRTGDLIVESPYWPVQLLDAAQPTPIPVATTSPEEPEPEATATPAE